jgi:nitrile hydratase accessory protein
LNGPKDFGVLARAPEEDGTPIFAESWHAKVLALAYALTARGIFSAGAFGEALGAALDQARQSGESDTEETYYRAALDALERLVTDCAPMTADLIEARAQDWRRAYLDTPHGHPVELGTLQQGLA